MTEIVIDDDMHGGGIVVDQHGVSFYTEHCACWSVPLDDPALVRSLYEAIGDWLYEKEGHR